VEVTEDAVAGADDRARLALDENAEGVAIAGEDSIDCPAGFEVDGRTVVRRGCVAFDRGDSGWSGPSRRGVGRRAPAG